MLRHQLELREAAEKQRRSELDQLLDEYGYGSEEEMLAFAVDESVLEETEERTRAYEQLRHTLKTRLDEAEKAGEGRSYVDTELLERLAEKHCRVITMEENVLNGGFGMSVSDWFRRNHPEVDVMNIALPDAYVEHGDVSVLREHLGIDSDSVLRKMKERYGF